MIRAVFFDMGSTLVFDDGFGERLREILVNILKPHGVGRGDVDRAMERWDDIPFERGLEEYWDLFRVALLLRRLGVMPTPLLVQEVYTSILNAWIEGYRFDEQARPVVVELKRRGYVVGIITNVGSYEATYRQLRRGGLMPLVDVVIASQEVVWKKPDPRIFRAAAHLAGVRPEEAVHVGDDPEADVKGAKSAGFKAIQRLKKGVDPAPEADAHINELGEVLDLVEKF